MDRRVLTAVVGLLASVAISVGIYVVTGQLFVFLFVPFVPFLLFRGRSGGGADRDRRPERTCPSCGFSTRRDYDYCPRDGTRLE